MREVNVLLTCIGGRFSRSTIKALKACQTLRLKVIGTDARSEVSARDEVDSFYKVPMGTEAGYIDEILRICEGERIRMIVPCSDEEAGTLSLSKDRFEKKGITCAVDNHDNVSLMNDKWRLSQALSGIGVKTPKMRLVRNAGELSEYAREFEYPERKVVLKPRYGRGARGIFVIGRDKDSRRLEDVAGLFDRLPDSLLMEYLPGEAYDVDLLAKGGRPICVVPRKREWKNVLSASSEGCLVERNEALIELITVVSRELKLEYVYDFDCGTAEDGYPAIYEVNPRFSGAIAAGVGAGVNIPCMLASMVFGAEMDHRLIKYGTRMRPLENGMMEFSYDKEAYSY